MDIPGAAGAPALPVVLAGVQSGGGRTVGRRGPAGVDGGSQAAAPEQVRMVRSHRRRRRQHVAAADDRRRRRHRHRCHEHHRTGVLPVAGTDPDWRECRAARHVVAHRRYLHHSGNGDAHGGYLRGPLGDPCSRDRGDGRGADGGASVHFLLRAVVVSDPARGDRKRSRIGARGERGLAHLLDRRAAWRGGVSAAVSVEL